MQNFFSHLKLTIKYFLSPKEIFLLSFLILLTTISFILITLNLTNYFKIDRIVYAGSMKEGVVGIPKVTNPFLANNQAEKNLAELLFTNILSVSEKIDKSSDGNEFKIYLKTNAKFSDGKSIRSEDAIYSLQNIPLEKNFSTEIISDKIFSVKFMKNSNSDNSNIFEFPLISKNENFNEAYSTNLITSSSFKIQNINKDADGNVTNINLQRYNNGEDKIPYLKKYSLYFYADENENLNNFLTKKNDFISGITGNSISKIKDDPSVKVLTSNLPNNFALFLNQNKSEILQDIAIRKALSESIDRGAMVNQVLGGYALPEKNILGENPRAGLKLENGVLYKEKSPVTVSITTINNKELVETAQFVANSWKKIGIQTTIKTIERSELQTVVKTRDFDILLFGFSVKNVSDYASFFHSRERTYPKLNIANYTRKKVDNILETLQDEKNPDRQQSLVKDLSAELSNDLPVILLYKPVFVQAVSANVHVQIPEKINNETDKYQNVENWYIYTEKVLKIFESVNVLKNTSIFMDKLLN